MERIVSYTSEELEAMRSRGESKTDWERVKRDYASDAPIPYDPAVDPYDPNDAAAVTAFWDNAKIVRRGRVLGSGTKVQKTVRFDIAVFEAFKATGKGWQTRMNEALKTYLKEHPLQPGA